MRLKSSLSWLLLVAVWLSGCTGPERLHANVIFPLSGTIWPPASVIPIHATADQPIKRMQFSANAIVVEDIAILPDNSTAEQMYEWTPPGPGEYEIGVRAYTSDTSYADSLTATVCVMDFVFPNEAANGAIYIGYAPYNYTGPCQPPRPNLNAPSSLGPSNLIVEMSTTARPPNIAYTWYCPNPGLGATIEFRALVHDPSHRVAFVVASYAANGYGATIMLNPTGETTAAGQRVYGAVTQNSPSYFYGNLPLWLTAASENHADTRVQWTALAVGASGEVLVSNGPYYIPTTGTFCGHAMPLVFATPNQTQFFILAPIVTATSQLSLIPVSPPSASAAPKLIPSPSPAVSELKVNKTANCRKGPGVAYDVVTAFKAGTSLTPVGRNEDSTWWNVNIPGGGTCFISHTTVDINGPVAQLVVMTPAPLPEAPSVFNDSPHCSKGGNEVRLSWTDVPNETGYRIYRNGELIASVRADITKYVDQAPLGEDFDYQLAAFNQYGESDRLDTQVGACS